MTTLNDASKQPLGFSTRAVHRGERGPKPSYTPTASPIHVSTSFGFDTMEDLDNAGVNGGYIYTRHGNPTTEALETVLADLEGTDGSVVFGTGMAAVHNALVNEVKAGDWIVAAKDVYGATYSMLASLLPGLGVQVELVDILDLDAVREAVGRLRPKVLFFETVSNPLIRVADLAGLAAIAREFGATSMVDNTFPTPMLCNPARLGIDVIIHSTTKYLAGHGDAAGGAVCTDAARVQRLRELIKMTGAVLGPFEAWLTLRGVKTLSLRLPRQSDNAAAVARYLADHPRISRVNYPGLMKLGDVERQFNGQLRGGMLSFEIANAGKPEVFLFLEALQVIVPAVTLGDVWSLLVYPAISSHRALTPEQRADVGIGEGLVRLSVGIEDVSDLIRDLDQALAASAAVQSVTSAN